ncbi:hypothetical protein RND81_09G115900 [Saponaria officinalis]|uniref:PB1 domain-containing protein n=1 Tax=Saponaria officinalis TaxID=3572 RepID=A0AAW1ILI1_SAPOF
MEPRFWMEFDCDNKRFDYAVYDVDLMQLLDLIGELEAVALKQDVLIPSVYNMYYEGTRGKKMYIRSDVDLMSMFAHFDGRDTIKVWMEDTINPIDLFRLSSELKKATSKPPLQPTNQPHQQLQNTPAEATSKPTSQPTTQPHQQPQNTPAEATSKPPSQPTTQPHQQPQNIPAQPNTTTLQSTTQTSPQPATEITPEPSSQPNTQPITQNSQPTTQPNTQTKQHSQCPTVDRFVSQPSQQISKLIPPKHNQQSQNTIPQITARRKGTYVPKSKKKIPSEGEGVKVRPKRNIIRPQSSREMGASDGSDDSTDVDYACSDEGESSEYEDALDVDDFEFEEESDSEGVHPFDVELK